MFTAYWAAKGGSGATVLAAAHAIASSEIWPTVLVDLDGDLPAALAVDPGDSGVSEWLSAGGGVPADALDRLLVPLSDRLSLLPRGTGPLDEQRADVLGRVLAATPRAVVVDAGTRPTGARASVAVHADRSVLVSRLCYLGVRRVHGAELAPSEVAVVREPSRSLVPADLEEVAGAPVRTIVSFEPGVARAVDAGLLRARLPRPLRRAASELAVR